MAIWTLFPFPYFSKRDSLQRLGRGVWLFILKDRNTKAYRTDIKRSQYMSWQCSLHLFNTGIYLFRFDLHYRIPFILIFSIGIHLAALSLQHLSLAYFSWSYPFNIYFFVCLQAINTFKSSTSVVELVMLLCSQVSYKNILNILFFKTPKQNKNACFYNRYSVPGSVHL